MGCGALRGGRRGRWPKRLSGQVEYLIDLSFELGVPLAQLRSMSAADLALYQRYTARRMFPGRRIEKLLAQVSMVLAQVNGHKARLADYLFDPIEDNDEDGPAPTPDEVASALNFTPRKRPPRSDQPQEHTDGKQPR